MSAPVAITLAGSTDNTTWTTIYTISTATPYDDSLHTYDMSSSSYYSSVRFIFTSIHGNDTMYLTGIYFAGYAVSAVTGALMNQTNLTYTITDANTGWGSSGSIFSTAPPIVQPGQPYIRCRLLPRTISVYIRTP